MPSINLRAPSIEWIEFVPLGEGSGLDKNMTRSAAIGHRHRDLNQDGLFLSSKSFSRHIHQYITARFISDSLSIARLLLQGQTAGAHILRNGSKCLVWYKDQVGLLLIPTLGVQWFWHLRLKTTSLCSKYRPASPPISGGPWDPFWGGSDEPLCDKLRSCMDRAAAATLDASLSAKGFWGSWIPRMSNWKLECWRSLRKFVWYWSTGFFNERIEENLPIPYLRVRAYQTYKKHGGCEGHLARGSGIKMAPALPGRNGKLMQKSDDTCWYTFVRTSIIGIHWINFLWSHSSPPLFKS